ncbi:MAG: FAD-dependent oxidoreductase [Candidatus Puniceispirillales bacterium]
MTASAPPPLTDIIIVGGGLAGLVTALMLAHRGHRSTIIDAGTPPADAEAIRTTTLNPAARDGLEAIGVLGRLAVTPTPIYTIEVSDQRLKPRRGFAVEDRLLGWDAADLETPLAHTARNRDLVEAALACVAENPLITHAIGLTISGFDPRHPDLGAAAARLTDSTGEDHACRLVVACDGGSSRLRSMAGIRTIRRKPGQTAIVADIRLNRPHQHKAWQRFLEGGPLALMPLDDPMLASLVWSMPDEEAQRLMDIGDDRFDAALNDAAISPFGDLAVASERHAWPLTLNHAIRPLAERLVLVGDAAHAIHPLAGQGFNLAMGDIKALADSLDWARDHGSDPGSASVLSRYGRGRFAEVAAMTMATDGLNLLFGKAPPSLRAAAAMTMSVLDRSPLKQVAMKFAEGRFSRRG